jgi:3-methyladenine DNA glycosylase/8-oxoguanine DNA glycosylase
VPALTRRRLLAHFSAADPTLGAVIEAAGPYRLVPDTGSTPFVHLARAITHQQISGAAARTILLRVLAIYTGAEAAAAALETGDGFPEPRQLLDTDDATLRGAGLSRSKVVALKDLAARALEGVVPDTATLAALDDAQIVERLTTVRGIGRWTVQMMLMFQLGRPDVLPAEDFGVRNGFRLAYGLRTLPAPAALAAYGARWAPLRSAAAWYLWRAVDLAKAGGLPAPPRPGPRLRLRRKSPKRLRTRVAPARARK